MNANTLLLPLLLAVCVCAHAENTYRIHFSSPSKNLVCGGDMPGEAGAVVCYVHETTAKPPLLQPADCPLDWGQMFALNRHGKAQMLCYSDYPFAADTPTLAYGKSIAGQGWRCSSSAQGIRCTNQSGHGFDISRQKQTLF